MSTTDYDEYFTNGPASGIGGGGGGGVAAGAGGLRFSRNGTTSTNTPLRFAGGSQMQFVGRSYVAFTSFSFQEFFWWGLTNDGTNIGVEVRQIRVIGGVATIIQNEIIDVPSYVQAAHYKSSLATKFSVQPEDQLYVRVVNSPTGGTAANVVNCAIQFKVEAA
jgi:hypothetical protein